MMITHSTLRILSVIFDMQLQPWELPAFRGAIASKVGLEHEWFHNHDNASDTTLNYHYRYPLIQYKLHKKRPMLLCLDNCVEEAQHLFAKANWEIWLKDRSYKLRIQELTAHEFGLSVLERPRLFRIHNWLGLNQEYFKQYQQVTGIIERIALLEKLLKTHLLAFFKQIGWDMPNELSLQIEKEYVHKYISFKGVKMLAFNLDFWANASIPDFIGIGKGISHGFGVVKSYK